MPYDIARPRLRLRPLAAALAFSIAASSSGFAALRDARLDALAERLIARDHAGALFAPHAPDGVPIVVGNCDDAGPGSLREAYFNAGDGAQIDLTGLTCSTITLTSGPLTNAARRRRSRSSARASTRSRSTAATRTASSCTTAAARSRSAA